MSIAFFTSAPPKQAMGMNFSEKRFPLGIGFLLSVLKQNGYEVDFHDRYLYEDYSFPEKEYEWVMIYSNTPCFEDTLRIINHYKGKAKIIVGGPHTSIYPETLADADYIVQGEGEEAMLYILKGDAKQYLLPTRISNLDSLPMPDYETFSKMPYTTEVKWTDKKPIYNYISSRGCPYRCTFCDTKRIWGRKYTFHSAERVISDIKYLIKTYGVQGIYFREDNFTCNRTRLIELCKGLKELNIVWLCETRVNSVDEEIVKLMAEAGCIMWYVGFESGSQHMLDVYQKDTTIEQGLKAAELAHKYGIKFAGSFIEHHPEETPEDRKLTSQFKSQIKADTVWVNKYRPSFDKYVEEVMKGKTWLT